MASKKTPMPHQSDALDYSLAVSHPAILMEMRLGKTLVAIWYAQDKIEKGPIIVMAPTTVLGAWEEELTGAGEDFVIAHGKSRTEKLHLMQTAFKWHRRCWYLITYESVLALPKLAVVPWELAVADESTKMKNPKAKISEVMTEGFRVTKRRMILTGLISPENELEVFMQFKFLDGHFMQCRNYWQFRNKYFEKDWMGYSWVPKKGVQGLIKKQVHARAFVLRRHEANMEKKKVYSKRYVSLNDKQRGLQEQIAEEYGYFKDDGTYEETAFAIVKQGWMRRIAGGFTPDGETVISTDKAKALLEILDELNGEQMVVWFKYKAEVELAYQVLQNAKVPTAKMTGLTPPIDRRSMIKDFRAGKYRVLLATEKVAKFGIDCSSASCAVYYSNEDSCEDRTQSEERILHPSKEDVLLYIDLVCEDSVDELVVDAMQDKTFNARAFMTAFDTFMANIKSGGSK